MAQGHIGAGVQDAPFAAAFIIQNNIRVALICFAGGVFLGIPTAVVLLSNGWMLGTIAAAVRLGGYDVQFWSLIVPHGVLELSIIIISGGALRCVCWLRCVCCLVAPGWCSSASASSSSAAAPG